MFLKQLYIYHRFIIISFCWLLHTGCQVYHNTTARFNSFFLANERMIEIENNLFANLDNDFNDLLPILTRLDTNFAKSQKENLDYVIEKASLLIKLHSSSKWVDNALLLIGKSRLYQGDYLNAIQIFKYINTISDEPNTRHQALVMLIRSFWETNQHQEVESIKEYIYKYNQSSFNRINARDYHLILAAYYQEKNNYSLSKQHLELALSHLTKREDKARILYILGQIYTLLHVPKKAHQAYKSALHLTPSYELELNAFLKSFSMIPMTDKKGILKSERHYKHLFKDEKNLEYQDKIYYEYALFLIRRKELEKAKIYLNKAIKESIENETQKAYAYLKLAQLFYEEKKFLQSAIYYDNTLQALPEKSRYYDRIKREAEILKEFSTVHKNLKSMERLLLLSSLTSEEREIYFKNEIKSEKEKIIQERERQNLIIHKKQRLAKGIENNQVEEETRKGSIWYFYNSTALVAGKSAFLRTWGSRGLEDNWRRSNKAIILVKEEANQSVETPLNREEEEEKINIFSDIESEAEREKKVPTTPEQIQSVKDSLAVHLFSLAKIYYYTLNEISLSFNTFERLIHQFPQAPSIPEAIYILIDMCKSYDSCESITYKDLLTNKYHKSLYAKMTINPNYVEEVNMINSNVKSLYATAFELYKKGNYSQAHSIVKEVLDKYPENELLDKVVLLDIILKGYLSRNKAAYQNTLNEFIKKFEDSNLIPFVKKLLDNFDQDSPSPERIKK